jgi:hypothetical protein
VLFLPVKLTFPLYNVFIYYGKSMLAIFSLNLKLFFVLFGFFLFICLLFETRSHCVAQAGLPKLMILLPQPPSAGITAVCYHPWPYI